MEFAAVQATNTVERTMKGEPPLPTEAFGSEGPAPLLESTGKPRSHDGCTIYENKHQAELDFFFFFSPQKIIVSNNGCKNDSGDNHTFLHFK